MHHFSLASVAIGLLIVAMTAPAFAAEEENQRRLPRPPVEAIEACEGITAEATCSFVNRRGHEIDGTCRERRERVACVPDRRPGKRRDARGEEPPDQE